MSRRSVGGFGVARRLARTTLPWLFALVSAIAAPAYAGQFAVYGAGASSCEEWIAMDPETGRSAKVQWVLGFVSGFNVSVSRMGARAMETGQAPVLLQASMLDQYLAWIDTTCRLPANTKRSVSEIVGILANHYSQAGG